MNNIEEFNNELKKIMIAETSINNDWQILIDERSDDLKIGSALYLYNEKIKTILVAKVKNSHDNSAILLNFYMKKYPVYQYNELDKKEIVSIKNKKELRELFKNDYSCSYSIKNEKYKLSDLVFKTKKIQDIAKNASNISDLYLTYSLLDVRKKSINKEEQEDFESGLKTYLKKNPGFKFSTNTFYNEGNSIYSQEFNILKNLLNINTNNDFAIKQIFLRDFSEEQISLLGSGLIYMLNKSKEKNIFKKNQIQFNDDYIYYMKNESNDFLVTQSQNGGYLLKKDGDTYKGYMFGSECLYRELEDLLDSGLGDELINIKINSNGDLIYYDSWLSYTAYNIISGVNSLYNRRNIQPHNEEKFAEIITEYKKELTIVKNKKNLEAKVNEIVNPQINKSINNKI